MGDKNSKKIIEGSFDPTLGCMEDFTFDLKDDAELTFADLFEAILKDFSRLNIFEGGYDGEEFTHFKGIVTKDFEQNVIKFGVGKDPAGKITEVVNTPEYEEVQNIATEENDPIYLFRMKPNDTLNAWIKGEGVHKAKEETGTTKNLKLQFGKYFANLIKGEKYKAWKQQADKQVVNEHAKTEDKPNEVTSSPDKKEEKNPSAAQSKKQKKSGNKSGKCVIS